MHTRPQRLCLPTQKKIKHWSRRNGHQEHWRESLIGYGGHTIYRVFIKDQSKVIRFKALQISQDYETKASINHPNYNSTLNFQGFLDEDQEESGTDETQPESACAGRKIIDKKKRINGCIISGWSKEFKAENARKPTATLSKVLPVPLFWSGRKVDDIENAIKPTTALSQISKSYRLHYLGQAKRLMTPRMQKSQKSHHLSQVKRAMTPRMRKSQRPLYFVLTQKLVKTRL